MTQTLLPWMNVIKTAVVGGQVYHDRVSVVATFTAEFSRAIEIVATVDHGT